MKSNHLFGESLYPITDIVTYVYERNSLRKFTFPAQSYHIIQSFDDMVKEQMEVFNENTMESDELKENKLIANQKLLLCFSRLDT